MADRHRGRRAEPIGLLEHDVDAVGRRDAPGRHERVAGRGSAAALRHDRERDAAARLGALDRLAVNLDAPHADLEAGRQHLETVARRDRARPERARDDRAGTREAEGAIDIQASRAGPPAGLRRRGDPCERSEELVEPPALRPRSRERSRWPAGARRRRRRSRERDRASTASTFVTATTPRSTPSSRRIRRCSSVCGLGPSPASTTSRKRSTPVAPATIVRTKRSWPGTSTTERKRAVGELELGVPERDRDPALPLLRQPVGVDSGQRLDELRLAVVDVARRCRA